MRMHKGLAGAVGVGVLATVALTAGPASAETVTKGGFGCTNGTYVAWRHTGNRQVESRVYNGSLVKIKTTGSQTDTSYHTSTNYTSYVYSDKQQLFTAGDISASSRLCHNT